VCDVRCGWVQGITNPYGQSKHMMEVILRDVAKSDPDWKVVLLRYFNPVCGTVSVWECTRV
jgi:UDP-glucose 4-epimerase